MTSREDQAEAIAEAATFFVENVADDRLPRDARLEIYRLSQLPAFARICGADVSRALDTAAAGEEVRR